MINDDLVLELIKEKLMHQDYKKLQKFYNSMHKFIIKNDEIYFYYLYLFHYLYLVHNFL